MTNSSEEDITNSKVWIYQLRMAESLLGMALNTLAWIVILYTKYLHNKTNYLLAYLAVTDSLACLCVFIYHLMNQMLALSLETSFTARILYCRLVRSQFIVMMTMYASVYGLCLVTYERYTAIVHPLHYPRRLSMRNLTLLVFLSWMASVMFSTPNMFLTTARKDALHVCSAIKYSSNTLEMSERVVMILFGYLFPILFMSWAYYKIQATLYRNAQQLHRQNIQAAGYQLLQARQKLINLLKIILGSMLVLWTPLVLWSLICFPTQTQKQPICTSSSSAFNAIIMFLFYMNWVINPIIYVFKYKKFQKGLQEIICRCFCRSKPRRIRVHVALNEHCF